MRLTIDAIPLLFRSAGVKNYLYHWIHHLRRQPAAPDIRLFPWLGDLPPLDHQAPLAGPVGTFLRLGSFFVWNRLPPVIGEPLVPAGGIFHSAKLLHPPRRTRLTATLHDFTCWLFPEMHQPANVAAEKLYAERILRRADGLIAVSECTRHDAIRLLGLKPEKIRVIYHGIDEAYFQAGPAASRCARAALGMERPYLLYVGTVEPRKNVDLLLDAWAALPPSIAEAHDLALAGPLGWASPRTLARLQTPPAGVRYLGYVAEALLPGLFAGAAAFVYPSLYEGFGFPVAQAMASGVPVITSAVSCLPEITGNAALLIDPRSVTELSAAITKLLTSPSLSANLAVRARAISARFTWTACAAESLDFFQSL